VHVTLRLRAGLPSLRRKQSFRAIHRAFVGGCTQRGFRLVHYSVQTNHLHLIVEATDARSLARAIQGLCVRLARKLNALFQRKGSLFADRYHAHVLVTPREVRSALRYVLNNARRHLPRLRRRCFREWIDPYSSAVWFDGWAGRRGRPMAVFGAAEARAGPLGRSDARFFPKAEPERAEARSHLLTHGWRRRGLIAIDEVPRGASD
jgi:REP element-mobilizing transposase RayT